MKMEFGTMSIVVGGSACNARCPFCVSKMTPPGGITPKAQEPDWFKFQSALGLAYAGGVTTILFTGKGEPTLWPDLLTQYLNKINEVADVAHHPIRFPLRELQTNGFRFNQDIEEYREHLMNWKGYGLTTIALSVVSTKREENQPIYAPHLDEYPVDLDWTINMLHGLGFAVRLCVMMVDGIVDSPDKVHEVAMWCKARDVEQLTVRPITTPQDRSGNPDVFDWTQSRTIPAHRLAVIHDYFEDNSTLLMRLAHGAPVYDYEGQNLCVSDCLTIDHDEGEKARQIIFMPDRVIYDWQMPGARIL